MTFTAQTPTIDRYRRSSTHLTRLALLAVLTLLALASAGSASADTRPIDQRTYVVKLSKIKSIDETGSFNFGGSDEIYGGFRAAPPGSTALGIQTKKMGDFDAGETRDQPSHQNCLSPWFIHSNTGAPWLSGFDNDSWTCLYGFRAPFDVTGYLYESDGYRPEFPIEFDPCGPAIDAFGARGCDDDSVGSGVVHFTPQGLAGDLLSPGQAKDYTFDFKGSGGHYAVTYQVTRES